MRKCPLCKGSGKGEDRSLYMIPENCPTCEGVGKVKTKKEIDAEEEKILANPKYFSKSFRNYSYLKRGLYCKQIENWMQYFRIEQFFIYSSENFYKDPKKTCYEIFDFLEIERFPVDVSSKHNQSDTKQFPPEKTIELMDDYFREPNQMLYELLSQSFEWDIVN